MHFPVVNVSCNAAQAFAEWLGRVCGRSFSLPKPDDWKLAIGTVIDGQAWWRTEIQAGRVGYFMTSNTLTEVGCFRSNKLGIYDLVGNVRDLCFDPTRRQAYACGGYYRSPENQLGEILELRPQDCRPETGFRVIERSGASLGEYYLTHDSRRERFP